MGHAFLILSILYITFKQWNLLSLLEVRITLSAHKTCFDFNWDIELYWSNEKWPIITTHCVKFFMFDKFYIVVKDSIILKTSVVKYMLLKIINRLIPRVEWVLEIALFRDLEFVQENLNSKFRFVW